VCLKFSALAVVAGPQPGLIANEGCAQVDYKHQSQTGDNTMGRGWENGTRVPTYDPRTDDDDVPKPTRRDPAALVMARRLVGFMLADPAPALGIECLALVTGIGYEGASMAEIGRRHGVTRAAVSKRCVELCEAFGVPPVRAMRPESCRERCKQSRLRKLSEA